MPESTVTETLPETAEPPKENPAQPDEKPLSQEKENGGRQNALLALEGLMPGLERIAKQTGDQEIIYRVGQCRKAVERSLTTPTAEEYAKDRNVMEWAKRHNVPGGSAFGIRGCLIRGSIPWMAEHAESIRRSVRTSLSAEDLKTAGYRAVKTLAVYFDPGEHGEDFRAFAEQMVIAAMQRCIFASSLVIHERPSMEFLRSPLPAAWPPAPSGDGRTAHRDTPAIAAADEHRQPERPAEKKPEERRGKGVAPAVAKEPTLTPAEEQERKRKRRLCRMAKDEHGIQVSQDEFDEAVRQLAEKFHPLAKGCVEKLNVPSSFRGGKGALRRAAIGCLPEALRGFDPAGGTHITQHIEQCILPKLQEMLKKGK